MKSTFAVRRSKISKIKAKLNEWQNSSRRSGRFPLLADPSPKRQKQEEKQEQENITQPTVAVVTTAKSGTKVVLQIGEMLGYTLLGTTGFFWLFWFNSPYFEYIEIPVIAGIILIAASFIYDTKNKKKEKRKWVLKIHKP